MYFPIDPGHLLRRYGSLQGHPHRGEREHEPRLQWEDLRPGEVRDLQRRRHQLGLVQARPHNVGAGG